MILADRYNESEKKGRLVPGGTGRTAECNKTIRFQMGGGKSSSGYGKGSTDEPYFWR